MPDSTAGFTPEQRERLTQIWDQLYELYLEQANGGRAAAVIEADIAKLIAERNAIRSWGWNTGQNWKEGIPPEELAKMLGQK